MSDWRDMDDDPPGWPQVGHVVEVCFVDGTTATGTLEGDTVADELVATLIGADGQTIDHYSAVAWRMRQGT